MIGFNRQNLDHPRVLPNVVVVFNHWIIARNVYPLFMFMVELFTGGVDRKETWMFTSCHAHTKRL